MLCALLSKVQTLAVASPIATHQLRLADISHRCCAPQLDNMLLHNAGQSEMLKLCDFGYSKDDGLGTEASGCKTACGTPEYMAPEVQRLAPPPAGSSPTAPFRLGYSRCQCGGPQLASPVSCFVRLGTTGLAPSTSCMTQM